MPLSERLPAVRLAVDGDEKMPSVVGIIGSPDN
jgi:hypothetical protein